MKKEFSVHWKESKKPRKKRKYIANAPLHIRRKLMAAHLSKELRKRYQRRSFPVRKGDTVKVMGGNFKNSVGKVSRVDLKNYVVYVENAQMNKRDGTKTFYPINPSNLLIQEFNLDDKTRVEALMRGKK